MLAKTNVFERAALLIEERGWCQHTWEDDKGGVCLLGAMSRLDLSNEEKAQFKSALNDLTNNFVAWNDRPWRTKEHVLNVLREVASI